MAKEGLSPKIRLIYFAADEKNKQEDEGDVRLGNTDDVERRLDELKKRLLQYDMFNPYFCSLWRLIDKLEKTQCLSLIQKI